MSYRRDLKRLHRAQKLAKRQQHQLATLELAGLTAITLHTHAGQLTIAIERLAGASLVDILQEALRDRRRVLQTEARQLLQDWQESEQLRAPQPSAADAPSS